jgi:2,4-dienoyl-CoA reductase (NADPH2)
MAKPRENELKKYETLFSPIKVGSLTLKNRIVKAPQSSEYWLEGQMITNRVIDLYEGIAEGGASMILIGAILFQPAEPELPFLFGGISDDRHIPGMSELASAVHKHDCHVLVQLHHPGPAPISATYTPLASTTLTVDQVPLDYCVPTRGVTIDEMEKMKADYIEAAARAQKAGFDGVECHSANGYFLLSFLSRAWNYRTDQYGPQSMENRTRLHCEIITAIRERCGKDFVIGVRINGQEFGHPNAITPAEAAEASKFLEAAGVDYISVTGYGYGKIPMQYVADYWPYPEPDDFMKPYVKRFKTGLTVPAAEAVKKAVNVPVITVGRLDEELGEEILRDGKADLILFGRPLWADHELPTKLAEGRQEDIVRCCRCATCEDPQDGPRRCRVNPALGREKELAITPAPVKKKVLVVGAGPAGMEVARVAALRGHEVTLCERSGHLGGKLHLAAMLKGTDFDDVSTIIEYLSRQVKRLPIAIKTGVEVDRQFVLDTKPDVVILAVGGLYGLPEGIPGILGSNVAGVASLSHAAELPLRLLGANAVGKLSTIALPGVGKNVVIVGGQIEGLQGAVFLKKRGRNVTVLEEGDTLGGRMPPRYLKRTLPWLAKEGVEVLTGVKYDEIVKDGVRITLSDGSKRAISADTVMVLLPPQANDRLKNEIGGAAPEGYSIGCGNGVDSSLIINALTEARETGCRV